MLLERALRIDGGNDDAYRLMGRAHEELGPAGRGARDIRTRRRIETPILGHACVAGSISPRSRQLPGRRARTSVP